MENRIIYQILSGITGAIVLGILLGYNLMIYGANNGCFSVIDSLMQSSGYESCGAFGFIIGIIVGAIIGVILSRNWKKFFNKK